MAPSADFLALVDEISETVAVPGYGEAESQSAFIHPAREVRVALDKLISRIDTLESDFDKLAEKSSGFFPFPELIYSDPDTRTMSLSLFVDTLIICSSVRIVVGESLKAQE